MPILQLFLLAVTAMLALAVSRLVLDHFDRDPPEGVRSFLLFLAFVFVVPVVFSLVTNPTAGSIVAIAMAPVYAVMLGGLLVVMWFAAQIVRIVARRRARPLLLLALMGNKGEHDDVPFDPPVTRKLGESVALVDRANAVFPRGPEFAAQVDRAGFRFGWESLDAATRRLEAAIADDRKLGLPVASTVKATALDARNRLDTLKRLAGERLTGTATA